MNRLTVRFTGRVQGVGFRYTTTRVARRHKVAGYVQNLPDGSVRCVAEGEGAQVDAFIDDVQEAMSRHISTADVTRGEATGEFGRPDQPDSFTVRH